MAQYPITIDKAPFTIISPFASAVYYQNTQSYSILFNGGQTSQTFDFTDIPTDANIITAEFTYKYTDTRNGSGYETIRYPNPDVEWEYMTSENFKKYLQLNVRTFNVMFSYRVQGYKSETKPSYVADGRRNVSEAKCYVVYEKDGKTSAICYYGTADGWVKCEMYYGKDNSYKSVEIGYGQSGEWK